MYRAPAQPPLKAPTTHTILGMQRFATGLGNRFIGLLDDVRLYGDALSAAELNALIQEAGPAPAGSNYPPIVSAGADQRFAR